MERRPLAKEPQHYLVSEKDAILIPSGCVLLDCVLGGGWAQGRVVNIAGDRSSGKTLLAIEACSNFASKYPNGRIRYLEAESAFDSRYAESLGMPLNRVAFVENIYTIEELHDDLTDFTKDTSHPGIYIVDSLDALSSKSELERKIEDGSYGGEKPKKIGEMFRRLIKPITASNVLLIIISQLRDKIGVTFGEKSQRSGGRALDFYASQILWLAEINKISQEIRGVKRAVGVEVAANCKKNKIGLAFRTCQFPILFGYGIDDLEASAVWLKDAAKIDLSTVGLNERRFHSDLKALRNEGGPEYLAMRAALSEAVVRNWRSIETEFMPKTRKY